MLREAQQRELENSSQPHSVRVGFFCILFFMFYLYILYSESSDKYYIGYTRDYRRSFHEHNHSDGDTYTSKHRPWILKAVFACGEIEAEAIRLERFIKKQKSRKLIERIIGGEVLTGILAQLVSVPHVRD